MEPRLSPGGHLRSLRICVQSRGFGTDSYRASYARTVRAQQRRGCTGVNARVPYRATTPGGFSIIEAFKIPLNSLRAVGLFAALLFPEALIAKGSHNDDKLRRSSMNGDRKWLLSPAD
jgi:hypothetical protein